MEADAACELLTQIFEEKGMPVSVLVGDDDSSFHANTWHSYQAKIDDPNIPFEAKDWPQNEKNIKLDNKGKLPLHVPEVETELADLTHCQKVFAKPLFELANAPKRSMNLYGWTKVNAEQMKANFGYYIKQHRPGRSKEKDFQSFCRDAQCIVDHFFHEHTHCRAWCYFSPE